MGGGNAIHRERYSAALRGERDRGSGGKRSCDEGVLGGGCRLRKILEILGAWEGGGGMSTLRGYFAGGARGGGSTRGGRRREGKKC